MTTVEMTTAEQQQYLYQMHDDNSGSRLATLTPRMPDGHARSVQIVEGGYTALIEGEVARKRSTTWSIGGSSKGPSKVNAQK